MSPVSPKPCSSTTAGPLPPTRTYRRVPLVGTICVRKLAGNGAMAATAAVIDRIASRPAREYRCISMKPLRIAANRRCSPDGYLSPSILRQDAGGHSQGSQGMLIAGDKPPPLILDPTGAADGRAGKKSLARPA